MHQHIRRPEEILAYRTLDRVLASKSSVLWSVAPADTVSTALQIMADKNIGFLVVLEDGALVGVLAERDCARHLLLRGQHYERHRNGSAGALFRYGYLTETRRGYPHLT